MREGKPHKNEPRCILWQKLGQREENDGVLFLCPLDISLTMNKGKPNSPNINEEDIMRGLG